MDKQVVSNRTSQSNNFADKYFCSSAHIPLHAKIYLLAIQAAPHILIHIKLRNVSIRCTLWRWLILNS